MQCACPRCRQESVLMYMGHHVCEKHWGLHCDDGRKFDLRDVFNIPHAPSVKKPMARPKPKARPKPGWKRRARTRG